MNLDKQKITQEYEKQVENIFSDPGHSHRTLEVKITEKSGFINVCVSQEYEHVQVTFSHLQLLSEIFKTDCIDLGEKNEFAGCETCDHGSSYMVNFAIRGIHLEQIASQRKLEVITETKLSE